jgi:peptidoglycan hydrolase-like protein with peptidoglycan-binding domain
VRQHEGWDIREAKRIPTVHQPDDDGSDVPHDNAFPELKQGDTGDLARHVQRFLWGSAQAKTMPVYGTFESKTETAVKGHHRMRGLFPDGKVGDRTWAPIRKALGL